MHAKHTVVWVDHHEAKVLRLQDGDATFEGLWIQGPDGQTHNKRHDDGHRHALDARYASAIAAALEGAEEILVCGPGSAKDELLVHLRAKHAAIAANVVGVVAADHPSERELAHRAREYFERADRMRGVHVS